MTRTPRKMSPTTVRMTTALLAAALALTSAHADAARRVTPRAGDDATATERSRRTLPASRTERVRRPAAAAAARVPGPADYARAGRMVKPAAPRPRLSPALRALVGSGVPKGDAQQAVDVRFEALPGRTGALLTRLGSRRAELLSVQGPVVRARLALADVESLLSPGLVRAAGLDAPRRRPASRSGTAAVAKTGDVLSAGVPITGADEWIGTDTSVYGLERATPVRVAILDFGFDGWADLVGTELPADVTTRDFAPDWDIEGCLGGLPPCIPDGTAMAEIVTDMAPDVSLVLVAVDPADLPSVDQAVTYVTTGGPGSTPVADIVVSGLAWQPGLYGDAFGTGPITTAVSRVTAAGIPWINDIGDKDFLSLLLFEFVPAVADHWHGSFADEVDHFFGGAFENDGYMDTWFAADDPGAGETWLNRFCLGSMDVLLIDLVWDDWDDADGDGDPAPTQDYSIDVYEDLGGGNIALFDSSANYFGNDQTGLEGQFPRDALDVANTGASPVCFFLAVFAESATGTNRFHVYWGADNDAAPGTVTADFVAPDSLTEGDRAIPADVPGIFAVASTAPDDSLEPFTTSGLPGEATPLLCAPDDVETVSLAGGFLTSFSAAHVAGAMALLMHKVNSLDQDAAIQVLEARARSVLPASDSRCGAGRLCTVLGGCPLP